MRQLAAVFLSGNIETSQSCANRIFRDHFQPPIRVRCSAKHCFRMHLTRRFALWTVLLAASSLWSHQCSHSSFDLRLSALGCVALKHSPGQCHIPEVYCALPHHITSIAPRLFSQIIVAAGPLWLWVPLFMQLRHRATSVSRSTVRTHGERAALVVAMLCFLAFIMLFRYVTKLTGGYFDPSGHVFVFGVQLVPLWLLLHALAMESQEFAGQAVADLGAADDPCSEPSNRPTAAHDATLDAGDAFVERRDSGAKLRKSPKTSAAGPGAAGNQSVESSAHLPQPRQNHHVHWMRVARFVEMVVYYMTAATASFFHTPIESFTSWTLILVFAVVANGIVEKTVRDPAHWWPRLQSAMVYVFRLWFLIAILAAGVVAGMVPVVWDKASSTAAISASALGDASGGGDDDSSGGSSSSSSTSSTSMGSGRGWALFTGFVCYDLCVMGAVCYLLHVEGKKAVKVHRATSTERGGAGPTSAPMQTVGDNG